jgi:hypothetical protein
MRSEGEDSFPLLGGKKVSGKVRESLCLVKKEKRKRKKGRTKTSCGAENSPCLEKLNEVCQTNMKIELKIP